MYGDANSALHARIMESPAPVIGRPSTTKPPHFPALSVCPYTRPGRGTISPSTLMDLKVLVANRGEIAIRILRSASELGWKTVAIYTDYDTSHATYADEAIMLNNVSDFLDVDIIVKIAYSTNCTHVHPGYGFISESPNLPLALLKLQTADKSVAFIGPSPDVLCIASDKMRSRDLATSLNIPISLGKHVSSADEVRAFSQDLGKGQGEIHQGYPLMIKALDGGGGRGIRIVHHQDEVDEAFQRCLGESPSKQVFVEKALAGRGWKHVEIQVIGDGITVNHFWERECSIQRRFQKIVEMAPSRLPRSVIKPLIDASLKMAKSLQYKGLGTFEFLLNARSPSEWVFLEINPRIQVEHTVTEEVNDIDLVRTQLQLFSSSPLSSPHTLASLGLGDPPISPKSFAIQLRLNAENPSKGFQLAPGTLRSGDVVWPSGRGVRVDTWLNTAPSHDIQLTVGTEFDSLLAKIIVKGSNFEEATQKGIRALREFQIADTGGGITPSTSVKTNSVVLAGTLGHKDWLGTCGEVHTLWLERNLEDVIALGHEILKKRSVLGLPVSNQIRVDDTHKTTLQGGGGNLLLQPGTMFSLTMSPAHQSLKKESETNGAAVKHSITITSIERNAFPTALSGTFMSTLPSPFLPADSVSGNLSHDASPIPFILTQSTSASVLSGQHQQFELADSNAAGHIASPMTGKIVELHPALVQNLSDTADTSRGPIEKVNVRQGQALLVLSVMKMENAITAPWDGYVQRVGKGIKLGAVLGESMLICVLEASSNPRKEYGHDVIDKARL